MAAARRVGMLTSSAVLLALCFHTAQGAPQAQAGRGLRGGNGTFMAQELERSLGSFLQDLHAGVDHGLRQRCSRIEASMARTFQALPKNGLGRLAPPSARHLVHSYFAKEHGWQISGLEPHGMQTNVTQVQDVSILRARAPAVLEALLEARLEDRGLSLEDVASMAALLERLILDESAGLLGEAYRLNGVDVSQPLAEEVLHHVLLTFVILLHRGGKPIKAGQLDRLIQDSLAPRPGSVPSMLDLSQDAIWNDQFARQHATNPFHEQRYSFDSAAGLANSLAERFGAWQNAECNQMREELMAIDTHGSGYVPLRAFYSQNSQHNFVFQEGQDYLRRIGALVESSGLSGPRVRIANYLQGPSNCIGSSTYFSVCCLSECEALTNSLEGSVQAPKAPAERLLQLVSNLSSSTVDAPRQLSKDLVQKLHSVAVANGGEVPLHGRLFAQWLHYAFPLECSYPHVAEDAKVMSVSYWQANNFTAPLAEILSHVVVKNDTDGGDAAEEMLSEDVGPAAASWSEEEILPLQAVPRKGPSVWAESIHVAVLIAMGFFLLRMGKSALATSGVAGGSGRKMKAKDGMLPL